MKDCYLINKYNKNIILSTLYYHGKHKYYYIKRFKIETNVTDKKFNFISETRGSKLILLSLCDKIMINYNCYFSN